ncbi:hypothetical protein WK25_19490 [Burkholderia latens]|nr:hypothetical protein WK25_19490 [Burkholderia latens]
MCARRRRQAVDAAGECLLRQRIEVQLHGVARAHVAKLRLAEIRDDPWMRLHQREQRLAGRDVLAGFDGLLADVAVRWRNDRRVAELQHRVVQLRIVLVRRGVRRLRGRERAAPLRVGRGDARAGGLARGVGRIELLLRQAARRLAGQLSRARIVEFGLVRIGVRGHERRVGLLDQRARATCIGVRLRDARALRGDAHVEIAPVDLHERVAGMHELVVVDEHALDGAGHARRDHVQVPGHVCIVGAAIACVELVHEQRDEQQREHRDCRNQRPARTCGRRGRRLRGSRRIGRRRGHVR